MKISKKTLSKWEFQEMREQRSSKKDGFRMKDDPNPGDSITVFSLPKCVLDDPKQANLNILKNLKKSNYQTYLQNCQVQATQTMQREYYNQLRTTVKNKTKQLFRPMKKHHSVIETFKTYSEQQKPIIKISKKAPISSQHSSQKALSILQKIILKQVDFYANNKKANMALQASKLPIIEYKQSKRKQFLAAYEALYSPHFPLVKYQPPHAKHPRSSVKKQIQTLQLSAWDITETNDF